MIFSWKPGLKRFYTVQVNSVIIFRFDFNDIHKKFSQTERQVTDQVLFYGIKYELLFADIVSDDLGICFSNL